MNMLKTLAALILCSVSLATFACQYTIGYIGNIPPTYEWNTREIPKLECRRYIYLSGINTPGNHISGVTYNNSGGSVKLCWTATNFVEVSMPLTLYIGVVDVYGGYAAYNQQNLSQTLRAGSEMSQITLIAQYRVIPDTTWHTVATKKFSSGDITLLSKLKLFGTMQINADIAPGSTVLIRLYVAVNQLTHYDLNVYSSYNNYGYTQTNERPYSTYVENADLDSLTVENISSINATETHESYVTMRGTATTNGQSYEVTDNLLSSDLHMCGSRYPEIDLIPQYLDYWTPQFVMAVRIANKRRPGNERH